MEMGLGHKLKNIRYSPSPSNFYTVLTMAYKTCLTADLLYNQYNMREREVSISSSDQSFDYVCYPHSPDVLQDRVGGRIATFRKGNYVADLGAMVVTGLGKTGRECWDTKWLPWTYIVCIIVDNVNFGAYFYKKKYSSGSKQAWMAECYFEITLQTHFLLRYKMTALKILSASLWIISIFGYIIYFIF